MKYILLVVAALLLTTQGKQATAADLPEHSSKYASDELTSKKMKKMLMMLEALGIDDPDMVEMLVNIQGRSKNGYLNLREERVAGGSLSLRYAMEGGVKVKQLELRYAPDNSHFEYTARTSAVMATYKLKF